MVTGVSGVNFSSTLTSSASMKAASTAISPTLMPIIWLPWPTVSDDAFEGGGLLGGLLQPLEGLAARVELAAGARDEAAGLHIVDLDALLALGREAELGLGLEPVGLGKGAQQHLAVADRDRPLVERAFARFAAVERVADRAPGRDEELDAALAALLGQLVAQDELVGPGHRIAGLVLAGGIARPGSSPAARPWCRVWSLSCGLASETGASSA